MPKRRVADSSQSHFTPEEVAELEMDEDELADADVIVGLFAEFGACIVVSAARAHEPDVVRAMWVSFAKKVIKFAKLTDR